MSETIYKILTLSDLHPQFLNNFNRFQKTTRAWVKYGDKMQLEDTDFVDDWGANKKRQVIESLQHSITSGGFVIGAFQGNMLAGFAAVEGTFFGAQKQTLEMSYIHVSNGIRHSGIGKALFERCCQEAKARGAKRLYLGAHPSQESQAFYRAMGCLPAKEINQEIYAREPLDIQLELPL